MPMQSTTRKIEYMLNYLNLLCTLMCINLRLRKYKLESAGCENRRLQIYNQQNKFLMIQTFSIILLPDWNTSMFEGQMYTTLTLKITKKGSNWSLFVNIVYNFVQIKRPRDLIAIYDSKFC